MNEGDSFTVTVTCLSVCLLDVIQLYGATSKVCFIDIENP